MQVVGSIYDIKFLDTVACPLRKGPCTDPPCWIHMMICKWLNIIALSKIAQENNSRLTTNLLH